MRRRSYLPLMLTCAISIATGPMTDTRSAEVAPAPSDTTPPAISITGPKKSGKYRSSKVLIKGTATDNADLQRWEYKINKGKWTTGGALSGTSAAWRKRVRKVKAGTNTVQVIAYDTAGLVSSIAKRKFRLKKE